MGTLEAENNSKTELDDSGCVEDESSPAKQKDGGPEGSEQYVGSAQLLDLSDDVLLYVLRHCTPRDLKALGFTCMRLADLIRDRTLWQRVDARGHPSGRARLRWLLDNTLHEGTVELCLSGYAVEARGCLGHVNRTRTDDDEVKENQRRRREGDNNNESNGQEGDGDRPGEEDRRDRGGQAARRVSIRGCVAPQPYPLVRQHARLHINAQQLPWMRNSPLWPDEPESDPAESPECAGRAGGCPGPQFTLTPHALRQLQERCSRLAVLALDYCNINCKTTGLNLFPPTLKKLSLRGVKCYNLPLDKGFLFKIQDYMPELEELDASECEWMEPASLLPLSKLRRLRALRLRHCHRLTEFVAYASLATRYGFRQLKMLDLRGSPVGDSEVSALGWVGALEELYLSPAPAVPPWPRDHSHYKGDKLPTHTELEPWETQEPECFKERPVETEDTSPDVSFEDIEEQITQIRRIEVRTRDSPEPEAAADRFLPGQDLEARIELELGQDDQEERERILAGLMTERDRVLAMRNRVQAELDYREQAEREQREREQRERERERDRPSKQSERDKRSKRRTENGGGDNDYSKPGPSNKRRKSDSQKKKPTKRKAEHSSSSEDEEDNICLKKLCPNVNEGASTSRDEPKKPRNNQKPMARASEKLSPKKRSNSSSDEEAPLRERSVERYVRFRQNEDPVVIQCPANDVRDEERVHHVLYVNVGQQVHAAYRMLPNRPLFHSIRNRNFRPNLRNIFHSPPPPHLDPTSLVTDSSIRRFGRADGESVNFVHIGPNGPYPAGVRDPGARPDRSNLRILSVTGFRLITNSSLVHLATAAPHLRVIDFSETGVTQEGVEAFKSLRPEVEVKFSPYVDRRDEEEPAE